MTRPRLPLLTLLLLSSILAKAAEEAPAPSNAETALAAYDAKVAAMNAEFSGAKADPADKEWVKKKLAHMAAVDQYSFKYRYGLKLDKEQTGLFNKSFGPRVDAVVKANTADLKALVARYGWFKISEFGEDAANDAAIIVQHAEGDHALQKEVLARMEKLYPEKEIPRRKFAFLFDRVAVHSLKPQRFGTQGYCSGPGRWTACPLEKPDDDAAVSARRAEAGVEPASLAEYRTYFKDVCQEAAKENPCR